MGTNTAMTLGPADLGLTKGNWIGRCQFPQRNVSFLNASVDEFHIFDRALARGRGQIADGIRRRDDRRRQRRVVSVRRGEWSPRRATRRPAADTRA